MVISRTNQPEQATTKSHATTQTTADILSAALEGFEAQKNRIDVRIAEIKQMLNGSGTGPSGVSEATAPRRNVSAASRRRMARAQRLRWKRIKQAVGPKADVTRPKRKLSAASRKRMAVAQKKRWAAIKAPSKTQPAVVKTARKAGVQKAPARKKVVNTPGQVLVQAAGR